MKYIIKLLGAVLVIVGFIFAMMDSPSMEVFYRTKAIAVLLIFVGVVAIEISRKKEIALDRREARKGQNTKLHHDYNMGKEDNQ